MNNNLPRDIYQAAYAEAEQELRLIQSEFERLTRRHHHVAKVVEVLKPGSSLRQPCRHRRYVTDKP